MFALALVVFAVPLPADESKISVAFEKTRLLYEMQKWQDVAVAAGELLAASPEHLEGHFMLAIAEIRLGQNESAIKRLTWLNFKVADSAVYRYSLAEALMAAGLVEQAVTQAQYAVQLAPAEEQYKKFLQRISAKTASATISAGVASQPVIAGNASDSGLGTQGKAEELSATETAVVAEEPTKERIPSEYESFIIELDASCAKKVDQEMQLIFAAVSEKPQLMADSGWSILQRRLHKPGKNLYREVLRQFLLWNSGELSIKGYEKFIMQPGVKNLDWHGDAVLAKIAERLVQYGVTPGHKAEQVTISSGDLSWFEALAKNVREAFFDARYDDAWACHLASDKTGAGNLWEYQAARLALELWQLHNFKREWLVIAQGHLQTCAGSGIWQDDAGILLTEVTSILEGKAAK
ncbi:MAG: hypothetical protein A2W80_00615 [Candidatus Riflebacteria bacterium GWC2_50_8]|nr:MAG: hypothetical protein A2W80_00615 [Candidatus Riflebacteria bacterium GWC2_50_8]